MLRIRYTGLGRRYFHHRRGVAHRAGIYRGTRVPRARYCVHGLACLTSPNVLSIAITSCSYSQSAHKGTRPGLVLGIARGDGNQVLIYDITVHNFQQRNRSNIRPLCSDEMAVCPVSPDVELLQQQCTNAALGIMSQCEGPRILGLWQVSERVPLRSKKDLSFRPTPLEARRSYSSPGPILVRWMESIYGSCSRV